MRARGHIATLLLRPSHNVVTGVPKLYISLCSTRRSLRHSLVLGRYLLRGGRPLPYSIVSFSLLSLFHIDRLI